MTSSHTNSYIVELGDEAIGLVQKRSAREDYVFFASDSRFEAMEGRRFSSPRAAELEARRLMDGNGARRTHVTFAKTDRREAFA